MTALLLNLLHCHTCAAPRRFRIHGGEGFTCEACRSPMPADALASPIPNPQGSMPVVAEVPASGALSRGQGSEERGTASSERLPSGNVLGDAFGELVGEGGRR